jgi:hypothetical protein
MRTPHAAYRLSVVAPEPFQTAGNNERLAEEVNVGGRVIWVAKRL